MTELLYCGQTFTGNNDRNTENKNILSGGVLAKTLRFIGQTSHNWFCLRTEIYGVKLKPGKRFPLRITSGEGIPLGVLSDLCRPAFPVGPDSISDQTGKKSYFRLRSRGSVQKCWNDVIKYNRKVRTTFCNFKFWGEWEDSSREIVKVLGWLKIKTFGKSEEKRDFNLVPKVFSVENEKTLGMRERSWFQTSRWPQILKWPPKRRDFTHRWSK